MRQTVLLIVQTVKLTAANQVNKDICSKLPKTNIIILPDVIFELQTYIRLIDLHFEHSY